MRKNNEESLGSIIKQMLRQFRMEEKIMEVRIHAVWEKTMGNDINRLTDRIVFKEKVLVVYLRSAPLREELSMAKTKIADMINKELESQVIKEILFR